MKTPCTRPDKHSGHSINVSFPSLCLSLFSNKIEIPGISQKTCLELLSPCLLTARAIPLSPEALKIQVQAALPIFS